MPPRLLPLPLQPGIPPLEGLVDEDDVVPDPLDALPGDVVLLSAAEEAEKPAGAVDDDGRHLPLRYDHLQVRHVSQSASIADVDDLLALEIPDPALHRAHPLP